MQRMLAMREMQGFAERSGGVGIRVAEAVPPLFAVLCAFYERMLLSMQNLLAYRGVDFELFSQEIWERILRA